MSEPINPLTLCEHVLPVSGCEGCQRLDELGALSPDLADVPFLVRTFRRLAVESDEHLAAELRAELDNDEGVAAWVGDGS